MSDEMSQFKVLSRFRLDELQIDDGRRVVLLILEGKNQKTGTVQRLEVVMPPDEAIRNGTALVEIGTALQATRH